MKMISTALAGWMLAITPAHSAGFERVTVPDPDGPALEAGIWYPSDAQPSPQQLGLYRQSVALGASVSGQGLPLIVMSHGSGGSFEGHYDTALALVEAGFVVAAITHTGDNYRDHSGFARLENRPRHIKALVDYMLTSWPQHDRLDPARIGMFGFSAGGFTALVVLGANPELGGVGEYCAAHPDEWACRKLSDLKAEDRAVPASFVHDPRISAAVVAAPAVGYSFTPQALAGVTAAIQLWRGDHDELLPHPRHAQNVYDSLPTKPEYHVVPNAGHFAFLAPCTALAEQYAPEICQDPEGFDRTAFHAEFNPAVVGFLKDRLQQRP